MRWVFSGTAPTQAEGAEGFHGDKAWRVGRGRGWGRAAFSAAWWERGFRGGFLHALKRPSREEVDQKPRASVFL